MTNAKPSRQDEAAAWFAAQRAGVMLVEQRAAFDEWRADPRNQVALDAMHELWGELAILKDGRGTLPKSRKPMPWRSALGAIIVVLALAGWGWFSVSREPLIATSIGQQRSESLPDGSVVAVNVDSKLTYRIGDEDRSVKLDDGEAAFAVKSDPKRPFVVHAGPLLIRAVGTSFNVKRRAGFIEIAVSEGNVEVCAFASGRPLDVLVNVGAGYRVRFADGSSRDLLGPVEAVPVTQVSEWRMRVVTYDDATVQDVVDDFNRYFDRKLLLDDSRLATQRVTVRLQVDDRDEAVATLAGLLGAHARPSTEGEVLAR